MAKASKEEQRKAPILRFKGFTDDWEQRKIKDTQTILTDGNYANLYPKSTDMVSSDKGIPFLTGGNLKDGYFSLKNAKYITKEKHNQLQSGHLKEDDIVIAVRGSLGELGYVTKQNIDWNINSQLAIIRTFKEELNGNFLLYFFLSSKGKSRLLSRQTGTALKQLPLQQLKTIIIPKTQILEQQKISDILNILDKIITLYERKVKLLLQVKKYFLNNLFAEKEYPNLRFKGFTDAWEQRKLLSNIENIIDYRGKTPKKLGLNWDGERNYPALSAINVENGKINLNKTEHFGNACLYSKWMKKTLKLGQVILTTEAPVGNVAQIKQMKHYILSQRVIAFETDKNLLDDFLYFLLQRYNSTLLRYSTGGTAKGISQKSLRQVKVNLTSNINEQKQISQLLSAIKNLLTLYEDKQQHLIEIKNTLLNTMFI